MLQNGWILGSSPGWIQGIRSVDGEAREIYRYREKKRKEIAVKIIEERKRLIFLCLCRKPIKPQTRDLHCSRRPQVPSWIAEGAPRWAPSHMGLRSLGRKVNPEGPYDPGSQPENKEKERHGETKLQWVRPKTIFQGSLYILSCT